MEGPDPLYALRNAFRIGAALDTVEKGRALRGAPGLSEGAEIERAALVLRALTALGDLQVGALL